MDQTLIILKPDAVQRGLMGSVIHRMERKGLSIIAMKMAILSKAVVEAHYEMHREKPFFESLVKFMTSGPVVLMVLQGNHAVDVCRKLIGATAGFKAEPGTIRGDYGMSAANNLIHGSDSNESAKIEIARFFKSDELLTCQPALHHWVYDTSGGKAQ